MNWVKALLLLSCFLLGCADLLTTNVILDHGLSELNPFMRLAQTWLGVWWLIPKLGATVIMTLLLWRSKNLYNISFVVALCFAPVVNNLFVIGHELNSKNCASCSNRRSICQPYRRGRSSHRVKNRKHRAISRVARSLSASRPYRPHFPASSERPNA